MIERNWHLLAKGCCLFRVRRLFCKGIRDVLVLGRNLFVGLTHQIANLDSCWKKIGLHGQNLLNVLGSMRKRIFTLMRCSCELLQNIIRNIDTDTIRFFWSSCTNVVLCVLWEVGFKIECVRLRLAYLSRTTCFQYIECKYTKHFLRWKTHW